jgi:hypothetical protein
MVIISLILAIIAFAISVITLTKNKEVKKEIITWLRSREVIELYRGATGPKGLQGEKGEYASIKDLLDELRKLNKKKKKKFRDLIAEEDLENYPIYCKDTKELREVFSRKEVNVGFVWDPNISITSYINCEEPQQDECEKIQGEIE